MPWVELDTSSRDALRNMGTVRGTTRFLLDQNVSAAVRRYLDGQGISATPLPLKLANRPDDEVLAEAWRLDRVLITHDEDFLDVRRHPYETNPGIVVVPGGSGNVGAHLNTIGNLLKLMQPWRGLWLQTYIHVLDNGIAVIKGVNATHGVIIEPWQLTFDGDGGPFMFLAEES